MEIVIYGSQGPLVSCEVLRTEFNVDSRIPDEEVEMHAMFNYMAIVKNIINLNHLDISKINIVGIYNIYACIKKRFLLYAEHILIPNLYYVIQRAYMGEFPQINRRNIYMFLVYLYYIPKYKNINSIRYFINNILCDGADASNLPDYAVNYFRFLDEHVDFLTKWDTNSDVVYEPLAIGFEIERELDQIRTDINNVFVNNNAFYATDVLEYLNMTSIDLAYIKSVISKYEEFNCMTTEELEALRYQYEKTLLRNYLLIVMEKKTRKLNFKFSTQESMEIYRQYVQEYEQAIIDLANRTDEYNKIMEIINYRVVEKNFNCHVAEIENHLKFYINSGLLEKKTEVLNSIKCPEEKLQYTSYVINPSTKDIYEISYDPGSNNYIITNEEDPDSDYF